MTDPDIIANAIAALKGDLDFFESMAQAQANNGYPVTKDLRERIAKGREALASLRAIAPASDAGRDGENERNLGNLFVGGQWLTLAADEKFESVSFGTGLFVVRTDKAIYDVVDGKLIDRALKSAAPAETPAHAKGESVGPETACLSAVASNEPCQTDGENILRCQICGFVVDTRFEAIKPTINFNMAGRTKSTPESPAPSQTPDEEAVTSVSAGPFRLEIPPNGVAILYEADAEGEHQLPGGVFYLEALVQFAGELIRLRAYQAERDSQREDNERHFDALKSAAPAETPARSQAPDETTNMICAKCGNKRYREWCPYCDTESHADQSEVDKIQHGFARITGLYACGMTSTKDVAEFATKNAATIINAFRCAKKLTSQTTDLGREAVIEEWNKLVHDFVCHAVNSWQWLSNAHTGIAKPGAADVISVHDDLHSLTDRWVELRQRGTPFDRALSAAPGEAVGRGGLTSEELREIDPINPWFIDALDELNRRDAERLPTADREAIREAMKEAREAIGPFARAFDFVDDRIRGEAAFDYKGMLRAIKIGDFRRAESSIAKLTAALALLGEG